MKLYHFTAFLALGLATGASTAAEQAHEGHGDGAMPASVPAAIGIPPASGKARESGFDGNDMMESTGIENVASVQCVQAARGIVMLDRAAAAKCGGADDRLVAPAAAPAAPASNEHQHHQ